MPLCLVWTIYTWQHFCYEFDFTIAWSSYKETKVLAINLLCREKRHIYDTNQKNLVNLAYFTGNAYNQYRWFSIPGIALPFSGAIHTRDRLQISLVVLRELKGNAQFVQKVTFEPLMDFIQNHYGSWKYYKTCYF